LPFHLACHFKNVDTAKYLFRLYPESIDIACSYGSYPIHHLCYGFCGDNLLVDARVLELTQFLLKHDRGAVEKRIILDQIPLHIATFSSQPLSIVKVVFDAYPEAIYAQCGETPLQLARRDESRVALESFFESQLEFLRKFAEVRTQDGNGQLLLIYRGLFNKDLSPGTIKLMVKANPAIIHAADSGGRIPLHAACQIGDFVIAKYLIETNVDSLEVYDLEGNCALHHACLGSNCDLINFILEKSNHGASARNSDGKLPIQMLLHDSVCNRNCLEYVSALYGLLLAYPNVTDIGL
jgi:hypothetical protein